MKSLLYVLLGFFVLGCSPQEQEKEIDKFDWLLGNWERTNESAGKQTYEQWQMLSPDRYQGIGFTMQGADTIWQESIQLVQRAGKWYFEVSGENEAQATVFTVVQYDSLGFRCENPENEFPTAITYRSQDDLLKATISGGDTQIPFDFKRQVRE